ncbi:MAG: PAS domain-containing protein [Fuerstiella sp.]
MRNTFDPQKFVECVGDAIIAVDRRGQIIFWNQAAQRLLGYASEDVLGQSMILTRRTH